MSRILIIDDEEAIRDLCAQVLTLAGHQVVTARDGFEGMSLYRAEPAEVILIDLLMPYAGLGVIQVLHKEHPGVPIIAMSGYGNGRLDIASGVGAKRTLSKPFTAETLLSAVSAVLPAARAK